MRDAQTIIKRPLLTEKSARLRETGGGAPAPAEGDELRAAGRVRGRSRREQDRDPRTRSRSCSRSRVTDVRTLDRARQGEARRSVLGSAPALEEGVRDAQGRRQHRVLRGSLSHGDQEVQADSPGRRGMSTPGLRRDHQGRAREEPARAQDRDRPAATTTAASPRASAAAATSSATASIDFKRNKTGVPATVVGDRVRPEPHGAHRAPPVRGRREGATSSRRRSSASATRSSSANSADIKPGNSLPLRFIPVGTEIHTVELKIGRGAQLGRSAGTHGHADGEGGRLGHAASALGRDAPRPPRLPRDHRRDRQHRARATSQWGKAGRTRWLGIRPHNRGVSMNPVDHPMGGGEGRSSGGRHPCTPWGQQTKGLKTRHNKRTDQFIVRRREQVRRQAMPRSAQEGSVRRPVPRRRRSSTAQKETNPNKRVIKT